MDSILFFCDAMKYVKDVRSEFAGEANPIYDEFLQILKEFRRGIISSSIAFSSVQTLVQNHPDLLDAFNTFKPRAAAEERSVDFINRVKLRFRGGEVYSEFLNLMHAYSCRLMSASDACDEVVELFGENDDLIEEVKGFFPESKKRKIGDQIQNQTDSDGESWKKRELNSKSSTSDLRRAAAKKIEARDRDNDMEESMCEIDARISNLEYCRKRAKRLKRRLSKGAVTAEKFLVAKHFTALNVACMRRADKKILEHLKRDVVNALPQLIQILIKNQASLEKQRLKAAQSWAKLRKITSQI